jgi:hypothetical protein
MRIISKFKDYYDSALSFGHDAHVVFERETTSIQISQRAEINPEYHFMIPSLGARRSSQRYIEEAITNRKGFEFEFDPFTVAFCGKLYHGIDIKYRKDRSFGDWTSNHFYDFNSYATQMTRYGFGLLEKKQKTYSWEQFPKGSPCCEEEVKNYFDASGSDHTDFFAERRQPIAVCLDGERTGFRVIYFNCTLKSQEFYRVFDAFTAFQELDMFISGVMAHDGNPMEAISDTDMRDKKGFDKMSFKKLPTKRR